MEHGSCNVIYIDRRSHDEFVRKENLSQSLVAKTSAAHIGHGYFSMPKSTPADVYTNVDAILSMFNQGKLLAHHSTCQILTHCSLYMQLRPFWSNTPHRNPPIDKGQHPNLCYHGYPLR